MRNHSEGLQSERENTGKRQRGRDRQFARHCACDALLFDRSNNKNVDFGANMHQKTIFQPNQMSETILKGFKVRGRIPGREREGEIESLLDTALVMHCYSTARTTKMLIFELKCTKKTIFQPNQM